MASINAKNVGKEVLETVGKGRKVILGKIIKKNGYAKNTADSPKQVTETKSYKSVVDPFVKKMIKERDRAIENLKKTISRAKYRDLVDGIDKLTKNIQLLTGGKTANVGFDDEVKDLANNAIASFLNDSPRNNKQGRPKAT